MKDVKTLGVITQIEHHFNYRIWVVPATLGSESGSKLTTAAAFVPALTTVWVTWPALFAA
jgi:hypothetical protein